MLSSKLLFEPLAARGKEIQPGTWFTLLIIRRAHQVLRKEKVLQLPFKMFLCWVFLWKVELSSTIAWWKMQSLVPTDISYSIPQWGGDLMSKCNLEMKYLRELLVFQIFSWSNFLSWNFDSHLAKRQSPIDTHRCLFAFHFSLSL